MTSLDEWTINGDIKIFEYSEFCNIEKAGEGAFGSVFMSDCKSCRIKVALKVLTNSSVNKFLKELNNLRKVCFHPNINQFYGITREPLSNNYMMVLQYANQGNLREYLKKKFKSLQWNDKIRMAMDVTSGLTCLHSNEIIHRDLHAKNILVHENKLIIADFGLSKQLTEVTSKSNVYGMAAYIDPQCFKNENFVRDKRSDIYSLGIILWEITSGLPPFSKIPNHTINYKVAMGYREQPVTDTPIAYINLYQECWNDDPNIRPTVGDVFNTLENLYFNINDESYEIPKVTEDLNRNDENTSDLIDQSNLQSQSKLTDIGDSISKLCLSQFDIKSIGDSTYVEPDEKSITEENIDKDNNIGHPENDLGKKEQLEEDGNETASDVKTMKANIIDKLNSIQSDKDLDKDLLEALRVLEDILGGKREDIHDEKPPSKKQNLIINVQGLDKKNDLGLPEDDMGKKEQLEEDRNDSHDVKLLEDSPYVEKNEENITEGDNSNKKNDLEQAETTSINSENEYITPNPYIKEYQIILKMLKSEDETTYEYALKKTVDLMEGLFGRDDIKEDMHTKNFIIGVARCLSESQLTHYGDSFARLELILRAIASVLHMLLQCDIKKIEKDICAPLYKSISTFWINYRSTESIYNANIMFTLREIRNYLRMIKDNQ